MTLLERSQAAEAKQAADERARDLMREKSDYDNANTALGKLLTSVLEIPREEVIELESRPVTRFYKQVPSVAVDELVFTVSDGSDPFSEGILLVGKKCAKCAKNLAWHWVQRLADLSFAVSQPDLCEECDRSTEILAPPTEVGYVPQAFTLEGMNLRDWFASQALAGIMASESETYTYGSIAEIADRAYKLADSMLRTRTANPAVPA